MTLQVSIDQFAETVKRLLGKAEAYVTRHESGTLVTAARPEKSFVVAAVAPSSREEVEKDLRGHGMDVYAGSWLPQDQVSSPSLGEREIFIAAVAYRSSENRPGLWVDVFPALPTQMTVLRNMYEEFRGTGQVDDVAFEEFVQMASVNVVIVSPTEIDSFLRSKEEC